VAPGQEALTLKADAALTGAAFSPDGTRLATAGADGVKVWNATPAKP